MGFWGFILGMFGGYELAKWNAAEAERLELFRVAREAADASGKPLLVIGVPRGRHPYGDTTVDLTCDGDESCVEADAADLPFEDGEFGAVFVGHVLEHVEDPCAVLQELKRVADEVFIAYPRSDTMIAWLHPEHTHLITQAPPEGELLFRRL